MAHSERVYPVGLFRVALVFITSALFTEATGPSNPVLWPVLIHGDALLFCAPQHRELKMVREVGWYLHHPTHDNWTYLLGIDRNINRNTSWNIHSGVDASRYSLYKDYFLKIANVTEKDVGMEIRCSIYGHKKENLHFILTQLDPEKASPPTTLPATTTAWSENVPITHRSTTDPVTEGKKTAGDIPSNDSDKENGCLVWKALTGIFAPILICHLLYVHGERLLTAGRGLFGHQDERHTTADASYKNCGDDETTSLGTMESCSIPQTFREQPDFL